MTDIVERLRFDAARCEASFSRGIAGNIEEAAAEIERLRARVADAEADAVRLHKVATDRWEALLELRCRDDRNGSLPKAYREIIDAELANTNEQSVSGVERIAGVTTRPPTGEIEQSAPEPPLKRNRSWGDDY